MTSKLKSLNTQHLGIVIIGQSNANTLFLNFGDTPTHTDLARILVGESTNVGLTPTWNTNVFEASNSYGLSSLIDSIHSSYLVPIKIITNGSGGASIATWNAALKPSEAYGQTLALIQRNLANVNYLVWIHGEEDAHLGTTKQAYKDGVIALYKRFLDDTGLTTDTLKFVITGVGEVTSGGFATTPNIQAIQDAQVELCSEIQGMVYAGDMSDIATSDGIHFTQGGSVTVGDRIGDSIVADIAAQLSDDNLNVPEESSGGGTSISFSANKNGTAQTGVLSGTETKLTFTNEEWDIGSHYDATNSKWTPPAGKYQIICSMVVDAGIVDQAGAYINLKKNGTLIKQSNETISGTSIGPEAFICGLVDANGTDYFEVFAYVTGTGNKTIGGAKHTTYFEGHSV